MQFTKPFLCEDHEKVKGSISFPKLVSLKLDGIRCLTVKGDAVTRSLKSIPNLHIRSMLAPYQHLDGEIIVGRINDPDVYRNTNSAVMSIEGAPVFRYFVFDELSDLSLSFEARNDKLYDRELPEFITILPQTLVSSEEGLSQIYADAVANRLEGLILRDPEARYKAGRYTATSQGALKMKPVAESDAHILSVYEAMHNTNEAFINELGQTERSTAQEGLEGSGMVGGFNARDTVTGVEFDCSPGVLTHDERRALWREWLENPDAVLARLIKYKHMPYGVKDKPRFPRYTGWRSPLDTGE